jgi:hypothetical protein
VFGVAPAREAVSTRGTSSSRLTHGSIPTGKAGTKTHRLKRIAKVTSKAGIETNPSQASGELSKL